MGSVLAPSWAPQGDIWEAKTAPKPIPKRLKIEAKIEEAKKAIQDDLGPVLERSWAVLGAILGRLGPQNRALALGGARFFENRLFGENEGSRGDLGRSWVDLGRPRGVKMRAEEGLKRS